VYTTNSGIFYSDGAGCLIDPAVLPVDMRGIRHLLAEQRIKPENLVITHYHYDHVLGPEHFPDVRVIAQSASQTALSSIDIDRLIAHVRQLESEHTIRRIKPFRIPEPDLTFERRMAVRVADLELELIHAPGHAPDQCVIYQPDAGILWAADMLSDLEIPFVYENLADYQQTLDDLKELDVKILVPGHGQLTENPMEIRKRFKEDIAYLAELRQRVEAAAASGKTLEETQTACEDMHFKHQKDNAGPHRINVEIAYNHLLSEG
jgi:glyoxylase-like metal-dependent hydrolase (beta-lactamase superfamily II)